MVFLVRIGVTGASGFLGGAIQEAIQRQDHWNINIQLPHTSEIRETQFLRKRLIESKVDALINTAVVRRPKKALDKYVNSELPCFLEKIFHSIHPDGVFVHVSSMNVLIPSLRDEYTQNKRESERRLRDTNTVIVRPSLIWSWEGKGDARRLEKLVKALPFMLFPGNTYLPVSVQQIAGKIVSLISRKSLRRIINITGVHPCSTWTLANHFAKKHHKWLIPLPTLPDIPFLPKILRTVDYTKFDEGRFQKADEHCELPFQFE